MKKVTIDNNSLEHSYVEIFISLSRDLTLLFSLVFCLHFAAASVL